MPAGPANSARLRAEEKKELRSCQSGLLRKVIRMGSKKSLLSLHHKFCIAAPTLIGI